MKGSEARSGGQVAIRGYLIQTLIGLLDALDDARPWLSVTLEPNIDSEKVDILWRFPDGRKAVQVKSSKNPFTKSDIEQWAAELEAWRRADEYELVLIGTPGSPSVAKLRHVGKVSVPQPLNLDLRAFKEQAAHRLDGFLQNNGLSTGNAAYREMVAGALAEKLETLSTEGRPLTRSGLVELLCAWTPQEAESQDVRSSMAICDGSPTISEPLSAENPWWLAVAASELWPKDESWSSTVIESFKAVLNRLTGTCWNAFKAACNSLPEDPWRDERFPQRVIERLGFLVLRLDPPVRLSASEISLLLAAPFAREAAISSAIATFAQALPLRLDSSGETEWRRAALERTYQQRSQLVRKAIQLRERGLEANHDAIALWLLHQCILHTPEVWLGPPRGCLSREFMSQLRRVQQTQPDCVGRTFAECQLIELARCVHADPERIQRTDHPNALLEKVTLAAGTPVEQVVREKLLGYLLSLAGWMAIDVRTLSEVLVDHVGLTDSLDPKDVAKVVSGAEWHPDGLGRTLRAVCSHPAVDLALRSHVERANEVLSLVQRKAEGKEDGMEVLRTLPTRLNCREILPVDNEEGRPAYELPHLQFHLAQNEIRDLLMGEHLYGDPTAAIRELYQNALDACRYRQARLRYLSQTVEGFRDDWEGRITFRQGADSDGRLFIECEDNGIGMGRRELEGCFARAGKRFADLPEFVEEQSQWMCCAESFRMYPNARFGIGVFSYFMLADELEIETCRLDRCAQPGSRLIVRVASSGSLFRIESAGLGPDAGTRVRLYLSRTAWNDKRISCLDKVLEFLWVAEFKTLVEENGRVCSWQPRRLQCDRLPEGSFVRAGDSDVWWTSNVGQVLADGIVVNASQYNFVVADLRGPNLPRLTLDRAGPMHGVSRAAAWDRAFVDEQLLTGWQGLINWTGLTMDWLWTVERQNWRLLELVVHELARRKQRLPVRTDEEEAEDLDACVSDVGCFYPDRHFLDSFCPTDRHLSGLSRLLEDSMPGWLVPYRLTIWEKQGVSVDAAVWNQVSRPSNPELCPRLVPGDAMILSRSFGQRDWLPDRLPVSHLIRTAAKLNETIVQTFDRFSRFKAVGLALPSCTDEAMRGFDPCADDLLLLSENLTEGGASIDDRVSAAHAVRSAAKLRKPLSDVVRRLKVYESLGVRIPQVTESELPGGAIAPESLRLLAQDFNDGGVSVGDRIGVARFVHLANRASKTLGEVGEQLRPFEAVGLRLPCLDTFAQALSPAKEDVTALSDISHWSTPIEEDQLQAADIAIIAFKLREPVVETASRLRQFAPLGLRLPTMDLAGLEGLRVDRVEACALRQQIGDYGPSVGESVSKVHLSLASAELGIPIPEMRTRLAQFAALGLRVAEVDAKEVQKLVKLSSEDVLALSVNCDSHWPWIEGKIAAAHVLRVANTIFESPGDVAQRLRRLRCLGIEVPDGDPATWAD